MSAPKFRCTSNEQCTQGGSCELTGFCSFVDSSCESGKRYSELAGEGLKNLCVGEESADAGVTITDDAPKLSGISFSSPFTEVAVFDPNLADYLVDVSLLASEIRLTIVAEATSMTISVNGAQVESGAESGPVTLDLGINSIVVKVTGTDGKFNTYVAKVTRAAKTAEQVAYIKASTTSEMDLLGGSVALSGDTLVIGAHGESSQTTDINEAPEGVSMNSGAVYVFRRTGGIWEEEAYIKASDTSAQSFFGFSTAISGDTLVVGAPGASGLGAVYVFTRTGTMWVQEDLISRVTTGINDRFGHSVAVSGDTMAVGIPGRDESGVVEIYDRVGTSWSTANAMHGNVSGDRFGSSVALVGDRLAIGADAQGIVAIDSGAAYVFERSGITWNEGVIVKAENADSFDAFGGSVALGTDTLVVGAMRESSSSASGLAPDGQPDNGSPSSGAAYVFRLEQDLWNQEAYLKGSNIGVSYEFGASVAVAGDRIAIGAKSDSSNADGSGAVYVFRQVLGGWTQEEQIQASNFAVGDNFGWSVAISADALAVGAIREDSASVGVGGDETDDMAESSGAVYLFQ